VIVSTLCVYNVEEVVGVGAGMRQGSGLSPLLFAIVIEVL